MGIHFTDKYSLLHFACGIVVYYWNVSFTAWFILHLIFELTENTELGMYYIRQVKLWPGGKMHPDSWINSTGDQFYSVLGWFFAYCIVTYIM
jgi:hypothetical protein